MRIERGDRELGPPEKSQGMWVSIGNKRFDPPPLKKLDPPGKCWTPLEAWKIIVFFEIYHWT